MNSSEEGQPAGFELVKLSDVSPTSIPRHEVLAETCSAIVPSPGKLIVTNVATDFRVERVNPLGEACRLIVALTVTFVYPARKTERLFRRYYVYEALDFTPERLVSTLRDMAKDIEVAAAELRSGAPCSFEAPTRSAKRKKKTG